MRFQDNEPEADILIVEITKPQPVNEQAEHCIKTSARCITVGLQRKYPLKWGIEKIQD